MYEGIIHATTQNFKTFNGVYHAAVEQDAITQDKKLVDTEFRQYPDKRTKHFSASWVTMLIISSVVSFTYLLNMTI